MRPLKFKSRTGRKTITSVVALSLVLGTLGGVSAVIGSNPSPAEAAATALKTGATSTALAASLAAELYPSGATKAVIAEDNELAILKGSVYAAKNGLPLLVAASGSTPSSVLPTLASLNAHDVVLFGETSGWFTPSFTSSLSAASVTVSSTYVSGGTITSWAAAASAPSVAEEYVMANSTNASAVDIAASYALTQGLPLVLWNSADTASALSNFFGSIGTAKITYFGTEQAPTTSMVEAQRERFAFIDTVDPQKTTTWVASQAQMAGASSNRVVVSMKNAPGSLGLAGLVARKSGGIALAAGTAAAITVDSRASEYLTLWKAETQSVTLVGLNLTATHLATLTAPTLVPRAAMPAFRVLDVTKSSSGSTLSLSTVSGATSYNAFDFEGVNVATSTTPSLSIPGELGGLLVTADGASGTVATLNIRTNQYEIAANRPSAVVASADQGTNHLLILGSADVPRLVTRSETNVFGEFPEESSVVPIAITCGLAFTDPGLDPQKQYTYAVSQLTNVAVKACNPALPASPSSAVAPIVSEVPVPPTEYPMGARGTGLERAAKLTVADRIIQESRASGDSSRGSAVGDGWTPVKVRWIAYIPDQFVPFPGYSGDLAKPYVGFGGDNHGTNLPNGSFRFYQDVTFHFGSTHQIVYSEDMGASHKVKYFPGSAPVVIATATAPRSELWLGYALSRPDGGRASFSASATLPLSDIAPAIDTEVTIEFGMSSSRIYGYHDNMPKHEAYIGNYPGLFYKVYESSYLGFAQLPCLSASPSAPRPAGCGVYFNAGL